MPVPARQTGRSVATNYRAALMAQTKLAFISKTSIVIEEADEKTINNRQSTIANQ